MSMCLRALGFPVSEASTDLVNKVMGAQPMHGAAWEQALACAQHYGCRATLTMPATVEQLKAWTDAGVPVMIAWNPEGRPWSHASVVFDVDADLNVYVADPNIPNPKQTVRVVSEDEFYGKWYEKFPDYLVRRPACAIEREITEDGHQVNILAGTSNSPHPLKLLGSRTAGWGNTRTASARVAFEVSVDDRGYAHDDEGNSWFVGEEYAGYIGRGHDLPKPTSYDRPYRPQTPLYDLQEQADKAILALIHEGKGQANHKNIGFLWSIHTWALKGRAPTAHQQRWWEGLLHRTESFVRKIPGKVRLDSNPNGLVFLGRGSEGATTKFVEDHFVLEGPFITGPLEKAAPPPPPPAPAPPAGSTQDKLRILDALLAVRQDNFIQSLRDQVARGRPLSEAQLKTIRQNLYRNRMRDEADHFREVKAAKNPMTLKIPAPTLRDPAAKALGDRGGMGGGSHKNKQDFERGHARNPKHKKPIDRDAAYSGNPDGKPIFDVKIDHGEDQPLSGGWDIMKRLQDRYLVEQGKKPRDPNPRLAYNIEQIEKVARRYVADQETK